jgi:hypothetical protein
MGAHRQDKDTPVLNSQKEELRRRLVEIRNGRPQDIEMNVKVVAAQSAQNSDIGLTLGNAQA